MPAGGLVIQRDGDPGAPDVTLNPRTEFYSHAVELEVFAAQPPGGAGEAALDQILSGIAGALRSDLSLGGLIENFVCGAPDVQAITIEGAPQMVSARLTLTVEYLVSDPLTV